jgi:WD40 repeat protein
MYDLNRREIVRRFRGHKQHLYLLKCDFGGVNESFVICGSDDGCVYVWSKEKGDLVTVLG